MSHTTSVVRSGVVCASLMTAMIGLAGRADAVVLLLDFGPTTINAASNTRDPYHASTGDAGNLTWNSPLQTANVSAGSLKYADGSVASGVAIDLGVASTTSLTSILATQPDSSNNLGTAYSSGIYAGNSSARDSVFYSGGSATDRGLSIQISGLAAGKYDIYYVGRNTNLYNNASSSVYSQTLYAGESSTAGDFDFSSYDFSTITYSTSNTQSSNWVLGGTYAKVTVDLDANGYLNLAFTGSGTETRAFLNSLQIASASVPEPAAFALLSVGCGAMIACKRRRQN